MRFNRGFLATIRFGQECIFSFIEEARHNAKTNFTFVHKPLIPAT